MRKIKFKRKTNKVFFSTRFFILIFIAIIVFTSSAYAVLNETLTLTGRISGQTVYTYYFEKPDDWDPNNIHAHIWINGGIGTTWPGPAMDYVTTSSNGKRVYKIQVTVDDPVTGALYNDHNYIIFNGGKGTGNQTADLPLDKSTMNNKLFTLSSTYSMTHPNTKRLAVKWSWTTVYAYIWYNDGSTNYYYAGNNTFQTVNNWPGVDITANKLSNDVFYIELDKSILPAGAKIIFGNGAGGGQSTGNQTADLTIPDGDDLTWTNASYWGETVSSGDWIDFIEYPTLFPSHTHN